MEVLLELWQWFMKTWWPWWHLGVSVIAFIVGAGFSVGLDGANPNPERTEEQDFWNAVGLGLVFGVLWPIVLVALIGSCVVALFRPRRK